MPGKVRQVPAVAFIAETLGDVLSTAFWRIQRRDKALEVGKVFGCYFQLMDSWLLQHDCCGVCDTTECTHVKCVERLYGRGVRGTVWPGHFNNPTWSVSLLSRLLAQTLFGHGSPANPKWVFIKLNKNFQYPAFFLLLNKLLNKIIYIPI